MKKFILMMFCLTTVFFCNSLIYADTGEFTKPFNENQSWSCGSGWNFTQYHSEYYSAVSKYHMGEDWNSNCGGADEDLGAPLYAIADGQVVFIDDSENGEVSGQGKRLYIRYTFPYAKNTARKITFDSAYYHLYDIDDNITWIEGVPGSGSQVTLGQTVAHLGKTGTSSAHLHWEAQTDLTIPLGINPYQNPLYISHALKYRAPSLIVDDHKANASYSLLTNQWSSFTVSWNAPGSIAYFKYNGNVKTIKDAISAGWVNSYGVIFSRDGGNSWQYYIDADNNFFENGVMYAIYSNMSGLVFKMPIPQNQFQPDRARLDMLHAVENDSDFISVKMDTEAPYSYNPDWSTDFELHTMAFNISGDSYAYVAQATSKTNPLIRHTCYYDPTIGSWTSWQEVGWNNLY